MKKLNYFAITLSATLLVGCGGGGTAGSVGSFFTLTGSQNVVVDGQDNYSGGATSYLTVGNNSNSLDSITEVYSNPLTSSQGPNRLSYDLDPGYEHTFNTSNCNQDYFLDVYFANGDYAALEYYRGCGYDYYFLFEN